MKRRIQCVLIEWFQVGFLSIQSLLFLFAIFCHFVAKNINFSCGWLCCYYRVTELWQTFCHNQGSKLRLIRSPMRLTFSPWRLKILVYSPKWRPDFRRVKLKKTFHLILLCFHHEKCAKSHKQSQFTSKFIPTSWYFQICWIMGFLGANFAENQSVKRPILCLFLRENSVRYQSVLSRSDQRF